MSNFIREQGIPGVIHDIQARKEKITSRETHGHVRLAEFRLKVRRFEAVW